MTEALVGFAAMLLLIFLQVPMAYAMALVGLVGTAYMRSWPSAYSMVGAVIYESGFQYMLSGRYWISIYPGVALILLIVAINLVGERIRDQLNPRLKR